LLASELVERLERLEGDVGLGALNLIFATMIATIVVCAAALAGDTVLAAAERRMGRRPGARLVTPLLAVCGATAATGILVAHLRHPLALDGWVALAGSLLLAIAAVAHHHLPDAPGPSER
jgi:CDP-diglyceride synthetase